jgi:signal transduction histidine kinase
MNLMVNAAHATPEGGCISVETTNNSKDVVVTIADSGCGIDNATMHRIFEPYFTTKVGTGTGLGLAQSMISPSRWGGRVIVTSEVGKATAFSLCFPAHFPDGRPANG